MFFSSPVYFSPPSASFLVNVNTAYFTSASPCTSTSHQAYTYSLFSPLSHPTTSPSLEHCFAMSRTGVVPTISRRSRLQPPTLDIWAPPPTDVELEATVMRVKARLAQRAADNVMRVKARLAQRAADKASAANVATKRQEVPRDPRVARQQWQHAPTLESKESSLKGMFHCRPTFQPHRLPWHLAHFITAIRHIVPARSDKSCAVQSVQPRNEPAGRCLTPRAKDSGKRFHLHPIDDC